MNKALLYGFLPAVLWVSCELHDLDEPLRNSPPQFGIEGDSFQAHLYYPDSLIGTLFASDRNGDSLGISTGAWNGSLTLETHARNESRFSLYFPHGMLGRAEGNFRVEDGRGGSDSLICSARRTFRNLLSHYPPNPEYWSLINISDTANISPYKESELQAGYRFSFAPGESAENSANAGIGLVSRFKAAGDWRCRVTIDSVLGWDRNLILGFYLSSAQGGSFFSGQVTGLRIKGSEVGTEWKGYGFLSRIHSFHRSFAEGGSGEVVLERRGAVIRISSRPDSTSQEHPLATFTYADGEALPDSLFLHLSMEVLDNTKVRQCIFRNLEIEEGVLAF